MAYQEFDWESVDISFPTSKRYPTRRGQDSSTNILHFTTKYPFPSINLSDQF
jgi:hypothetical protein